MDLTKGTGGESSKKRIMELNLGQPGELSAQDSKSRLVWYRFNSCIPWLSELEGDMNQKTIKALKGSIVKWEKIVDGTGIDEGGDNCPLCILVDFECNFCPVFNKTGKIVCNGTPYVKWVNHHVNHKLSYRNRDCPEVECKICERHAKAEVEFLKSLLPAGV